MNLLLLCALSLELLLHSLPHAPSVNFIKTNQINSLKLLKEFKNFIIQHAEQKVSYTRIDQHECSPN